MTEPVINGVPLREYVEALFKEREKAVDKALEAQEKAVTAALEASDKAITKAEANAEKWRENANEWRGAMSDRDRELPSRREVEAAAKGLEEKDKALSDRVTVLEAQTYRGSGRMEREEKAAANQHAIIGYLIGSVGVGAAVIALIVR